MGHTATGGWGDAGLWPQVIHGECGVRLTFSPYWAFIWI